MYVDLCRCLHCYTTADPIPCSLPMCMYIVPAPAELPKDDIALTRPTCQPFKMVDAARDSKRSNGLVGERREQFFAASGGSSPSLVPHPHRHYRVCSPTHRTVFALKKVNPTHSLLPSHVLCPPVYVGRSCV